MLTPTRAPPDFFVETATPIETFMKSAKSAMARFMYGVGSPAKAIHEPSGSSSSPAAALSDKSRKPGSWTSSSLALKANSPSVGSSAAGPSHSRPNASSFSCE